ncbi:uncharacterized protein LOC106087529 [Stomoxys calcitrans]|uniref:uncharacterized protein LOC106087529 n=1 Tax=Stomoxys calcitrans TaxID=35570 RepID=UPI0027E368AF|nr:uncharacterized protein LOC106087529 [Stomoxys calcitrans]
MALNDLATVGENHWTPQNDRTNNYQKLLQNIYNKKEFESILLAYKTHSLPEALSHAIETLQVPQVSITELQAAFFFRGNFNANILAILIINISMDLELMKSLAITLDYMRQTRILTLASDVPDKELLKMQFLLCWKSYNMTNVVLKFIDNQEEILWDELYVLKPYPEYHWFSQKNMSQLYQPHWKNMHNKSLLTFVDQSVPRSLYFKDNEGNWKLNGYVPRLVLLFAECFNASLRMAYPLSLESPTHYSVILINMARENLLDIPMVQDTSANAGIWMNWTDVYDFNQGMFIVPCAQTLNTREVYTILLNGYFLGCIFISIMLISALHSLIDYIFDDLWQPSHVLFSDRIFPGVLGQSFAARSSHSRSLQIVYILLFIVGLYLNTEFSVKVSTLLTSPPYHRQLETMQDIVNSPLKILLQEAEAEAMSIFTTNYVDSIVTTSNHTYLMDIRQNLNTTFGYFISLGLWQILRRKQQFYTHQVFCTFDNLTLFENLPWGIPLQQNSPYAEALNYLIHQVHAFGLKDAWISSTFSDMLKLKEITLRNPYKEQGPKPLTVNDLFWTWILVFVGLLVSSIVFLVEIMWIRISQRNRL